MNYSIIIYIIGWILNTAGALMLLPCITALIYQERQGFAFVFTMGFCFLLGILMTFRKPKKKAFYIREGFVTVAMSWIVLSVVGCVPFVISRSIPNPFNAFFEVVSGFTTTGASILTDVEALPHCMLLWRSFTHWIGGMGVLVFVLALLPLNGGYHMNLMKAESPGPSVSRILPKVRSTAIILYQIYFLLTILEMFILLILRMPVFDTICISFGTAGTGGFGVLNSSCGDYTIPQQVVITIFMILFGINFNVYFLLLTRKVLQALRIEELRCYLAIICSAILLITVNIMHLAGGFLKALQQAAFQVGSIITTTGYSTVDFNRWPDFSKAILVMLMFVGACAGSTGGGMKVSRIIIMAKTVTKEFLLYLHPNAVKKVKMDGKPISHEVVRSTNIFLITYVVVFACSALLISLDNLGFTTNFTAVAATINNIGPGLDIVGPSGNYALYSNFSKLVLSFDMLAGRLELFPLLLLFFPGTWKEF